MNIVKFIKMQLNINNYVIYAMRESQKLKNNRAI